jgi:hypothetical protein
VSPAELRDGGAEPDVLAIAPRPADRRLVRTLVVLALVGALALGGLTAWQRLRPPPDLTLAQLQQAYAGMVRSDGTNEVALIDPDSFRGPGLALDADPCARLFAGVVSTRFPGPALDGVSTYRLERSGSVALFTVRYADARAARTAYDDVLSGTAGCQGRAVTFSPREGAGVLAPVPPPGGAPAQRRPGERAADQRAYSWQAASGRVRYAVHLLRLRNTVTWQYRYQVLSRFADTDSRPVAPYDPVPAQQAADGLAAALRSLAGRDGP